MKGPRKRSDKDDLNFEASFERLVESINTWIPAGCLEELELNKN